MKHLILALVVGIVSTAAHADTFTYRCTLQGKAYPLKVVGNTLTWKGKAYRTTDLDAGADNNPCPRFGWHVTGQGEAFDFCTATQGYANFTDGGANIECRQQNR